MKKGERSYEKDKYFQTWLVGLSERTKTNYTEEFEGWFAFVKMSPTEQIEKRWLCFPCSIALMDFTREYPQKCPMCGSEFGD